MIVAHHDRVQCSVRATDNSSRVGFAVVDYPRGRACATSRPLSRPVRRLSPCPYLSWKRYQACLYAFVPSVAITRSSFPRSIRVSHTTHLPQDRAPPARDWQRHAYLTRAFSWVARFSQRRSSTCRGDSSRRRQSRSRKSAGRSRASPSPTQPPRLRPGKPGYSRLHHCG